MPFRYCLRCLFVGKLSASQELKSKFSNSPSGVWHNEKIDTWKQFKWNGGENDNGELKIDDRENGTDVTNDDGCNQC